MIFLATFLITDFVLKIIRFDENIEFLIQERPVAIAENYGHLKKTDVFKVM
jgi:hypothetical protein